MASWRKAAACLAMAMWRSSSMCLASGGESVTGWLERSAKKRRKRSVAAYGVSKAKQRMAIVSWHGSGISKRKRHGVKMISSGIICKSGGIAYGESVAVYRGACARGITKITANKQSVAGNNGARK